MKIITEELLLQFRMEIINEIKALINPPQKPENKYLNSSEVRKIFQISETKLYELRRDGKIPFIKVDGKYLYKESDLLNAFKK